LTSKSSTVEVSVFERRLVLEIELASEGELIDELARLRPEETALLVLLKSRSSGGVSVSELMSG
jgi:hypothetical protein